MNVVLEKRNFVSISVLETFTCVIAARGASYVLAAPRNHAPADADLSLPGLSTRGDWLTLPRRGGDSVARRATALHSFLRQQRALKITGKGNKGSLSLGYLPIFFRLTRWTETVQRLQKQPLIVLYTLYIDPKI